MSNFDYVEDTSALSRFRNGAIFAGGAMFAAAAAMSISPEHPQLAAAGLLAVGGLAVGKAFKSVLYKDGAGLAGGIGMIAVSNTAAKYGPDLVNTITQNPEASLGIGAAVLCVSGALAYAAKTIGKKIEAKKAADADAAFKAKVEDLKYRYG